MIDQSSTLFLQRKPTIKRLGKLYNILSDHKFVGTVEETNDTVHNLGNQLLKLTPFFNTVSIHLNVFDLHGNILGTIKKKKGYYNDFQCYSKISHHQITFKTKLIYYMCN